jgi:hypothetical protein
MNIENCPKCKRPRAIGYSCPSCGEAATPVEGTPGAPNPWQPDPAVWKTTPKPGGVPAGQRVSGALGSTPQGKSRKGLIATVIVSLIVIAVVGVVAVMLTTGGAALVEEEAAVAAAPEKAYDEAAQTLLRNAMTAVDAAFVESADYASVNVSMLGTMEPAIHWKEGRPGIYSGPPTSAKTAQNAVAFIGTGRLTYELGTWSTSGAKFGVKMDKAGGGATYYRDGQAGAW